jgi:hypothetical protein
MRRVRDALRRIMINPATAGGLKDKRYLAAISATNRFSDSHLCSALILSYCCHDSNQFLNESCRKYRASMHCRQ